jgi:NarL family two-component system response regulator LiaR
MRPVKSPLTPREWEVLDLLKDGKSTSGTARELAISPETVHSHVRHVL